jgi:hypothetical protein
MPWKSCYDDIRTDIRELPQDHVEQRALAFSVFNFRDLSNPVSVWVNKSWTWLHIYIYVLCCNNKQNIMHLLIIFIRNFAVLYSVIDKSRNPFLTEDKNQCYIKCWKYLPRSAMHTFTLFLMFDATRWRVPAVTVNRSPDEILSTCLSQENREMYP